ncbi:hypothetical protein [Lactobacillus selangorensis]|uniref:hypothetical protein n=1 Tax=Lactobacillus selangorensis TaxID=81857 RepID=UPI000711068D|nr:hypothetical protein [Lactobacillus selangorensis]
MYDSFTTEFNGRRCFVELGEGTLMVTDCESGEYLMTMFDNQVEAAAEFYDRMFGGAEWTHF